MRRSVALTIVLAACTILIGCNPGGNNTANSGGDTKVINIDGSSTVEPITKAVAKEFENQNKTVKINVGISGTGGGFKKFAKGETDISDASRPIRPGEAEDCKRNGIKYVELQVAWDGLAVVINNENTWAKKLTVAQLNHIWRKDNPAKLWSDVDPTWPKEEIKLFGAGADSGTFDYFTEVINGKEKVSRTDYQATEDDNITVQGVAKDKYALGYFGVAYYEQNKDKLQVAAIAAKESDDYVLPTIENVLTKKYKPLSRPLFIYVKEDSLKRPEVQEFCKFYLRRNELVAKVGYVRMDSLQEAAMKKRLEEALSTAR